MKKTSIEEKVRKAHEVIRKASTLVPNDQIAIAWTGGKDSTVVLHLVREAFGGKMPFKVMFNDSTLEFKEIYDFVRRLEKEWGLDLLWVKHLDSDLQHYTKAIETEKKMEVMRIAKIHAINHAISEYNIGAFVAGIRWDEHESRPKETYFSKRDSHLRVHPILHFTLDDIWKYIRLYNVPYVDLYDKGYKSLGEEPFTKPVKDPNAPERAGREATKEKTMNRLRDLGYW